MNTVWPPRPPPAVAGSPPGGNLGALSLGWKLLGSAGHVSILCRGMQQPPPAPCPLLPAPAGWCDNAVFARSPDTCTPIPHSRKVSGPPSLSLPPKHQDTPTLEATLLEGRGCSLPFGNAFLPEPCSRESLLSSVPGGCSEWGSRTDSPGPARISQGWASAPPARSHPLGDLTCGHTQDNWNTARGHLSTESGGGVCPGLGDEEQPAGGTGLQEAGDKLRGVSPGQWGPRP